MTTMQKAYYGAIFAVVLWFNRADAALGLDWLAGHYREIVAPRWDTPLFLITICLISFAFMCWEPDA